MNPKVILASGSPRRRELLQKAGLSFTVAVSSAEENASSEIPGEMVRELAQVKAEAVRDMLEDQGGGEYIVIGADTVVSVDGKVLGKPKDPEEAAAMIRLIEGRYHEVYTGVCLIRTSADEEKRCEKSFSECTKVHVLPMTEEEVLNYVSCGESMDKAGAYAIQGQFGKYIDRFEGDYENVIGLPVRRVLEEIRALADES